MMSYISCPYPFASLYFSKIFTYLPTHLCSFPFSPSLLPSLPSFLPSSLFLFPPCLYRSPILGHGSCPTVLLIYQFFWRKLTFPHPAMNLIKSSLAGARLHVPHLFSMLVFCQDCACTSLIHAATISMRLYVHPPSIVWKTLFPWSQLPPLALKIFTPFLHNLWALRGEVWYRHPI